MMTNSTTSASGMTFAQRNHRYCGSIISIHQNDDDNNHHMQHLDDASSELLSAYATEYMNQPTTTDPNTSPNPLLHTLEKRFLASIRSRHQRHSPPPSNISLLRRLTDDDNGTKIPQQSPRTNGTKTATIVGTDNHTLSPPPSSHHGEGGLMGNELSSIWNLLRAVHREGYDAAAILRRICSTTATNDADGDGGRDYYRHRLMDVSVASDRRRRRMEERRYHQHHSHNDDDDHRDGVDLDVEDEGEYVPHATHPTLHRPQQQHQQHQYRTRSSSVFSPLDDSSSTSSSDDDDDDDADDDDNDTNPHTHTVTNRNSQSSHHHHYGITTRESATTPLTFGRPGHFALGRISHNGSRPRRVEGDLRDVLRDVVDVSCGNHHTVFLDGGGVVWTCGLGKGGRLGTGDEHHRPLPVPLLTTPLSTDGRKVLSVSCSENHTLACTNDGGVYAWGSDRFGQLSGRAGGSGGNGVEGGNGGVGVGGKVNMVPRLVEGQALRGVFVVAVAAGTRHSIVLDREGVVYSWGDNRHGQCGRRAYNTQILSPAPVDTFTPSNNNSTSTPRRTATSIAAGDFATLSLILPPSNNPNRHHLPLALYSWGFGSYKPARVSFPAPPPPSPGARAREEEEEQCRRVVYPIRIAAAKFHFVASDVEGRVYTWGMKQDPLGITDPKTISTNTKSGDNGGGGGSGCGSASGYMTKEGIIIPQPLSSSGVATSTTTESSNHRSKVVLHPQPVRSLCPNRHGKIIALAASDDHTAVVTDTGDLYTWGTTTVSSGVGVGAGREGGDGGALGHGRAVRYQPIPKRVRGVVRAVSIAAARDHSVVLVGGQKVATAPSASTTPESLPRMLLPEEEQERHGEIHTNTLQSLCEDVVADCITVFNVVSVLAYADAIGSERLVLAAREFVRLNLDGVLVYSDKADLDLLLPLDFDDNDNGSGDDVDKCDCWNEEDCGVMTKIDDIGCSSGNSSFSSCAAAAAAATAKTKMTEDGEDRLLQAVGSDDSKDEEEEKVEEEEVRAIEPSPPTMPTATTQTPPPRKPSVAEQISQCLDVTNTETLSSNWIISTKELRSVRKKLARIIEKEEKFNPPSKHPEDADGRQESRRNDNKMGRDKASLEHDVRLLKNNLERIERSLRAFRLDVPKMMDGRLSGVAAVPQTTTRTTTTMKTNVTPTTGEKPSSYLDDDMKPKSIDDKTTTTTNCPEPHQTDTDTDTTATNTFHCKICNVRCPDPNSFTLHMSGPRHRNMMARLEQEQQKETLAQIRATKRRNNLDRQLSSDNPIVTPHDDGLKCKATPKRNINSGGVGTTTTTPKVSFQEILRDEEERHRMAAAQQQHTSSSTTTITKISTRSNDGINANTAATTVLPMWRANSTTASLTSYSSPSSSLLPKTKDVTTVRNGGVASSGGNGKIEQQHHYPAVSLIDYLSPQKTKKTKKTTKKTMMMKKRLNDDQGNNSLSATAVIAATSPTGSAWNRHLRPTSVPSAQSTTTCSSTIHNHTKTMDGNILPISSSTSPPPSITNAPNDALTPSLTEIQREEECKVAPQSFLHNSDSKWYRARRDRALSIGEIQKREEEEAEMARMVKEQFEIEAQIKAAAASAARENARSRRMVGSGKGTRRRKGGGQGGNLRKSGGGGGRRMKNDSQNHITEIPKELCDDVVVAVTINNTDDITDTGHYDGNNYGCNIKVSNDTKKSENKGRGTKKKRYRLKRNDKWNVEEKR